MSRLAWALVLVACLVACTREPEQGAPPDSVATREPEQTVSPDAVNSAELGQGEVVLSQAALIRAKVLLDRAQFSPGVIDGADNENVRKAIGAFKRQHGLKPDREFDEETWRKLSETSHEPALVEYTITHDDVKGPFLDKLPTSMEDQADLDHLGYTSPMELLAEKFHMSESLLTTLNPDKPLDRAGTSIFVANVLDGRDQADTKATKIEVEKNARNVRVLDQAGSVIAFYPASIGSPEKQTPSGAHKVTNVAKHPTYTYNPEYSFEEVQTRKKFTIKPGPNNPVGAVWIGVDVESYAVHGTPEPEKVGESYSHGCVRLTNWDAVRLAGMVRKGTPVEFVD